jgi:hypothetical protein
MKSKWNVDPKQPTTIARLISELEGVSYILSSYDEPEEYEYIQKMKQKYFSIFTYVVRMKKIDSVALCLMVINL